MALFDQVFEVVEPKRWVRSSNDGQLGYLVRHDGEMKVKLDRSEVILKPFNQHQWRDAEDIRALTPMQAARVAYEADRAYRLATGTQPSLAKEWISLKDEERIAWTRTPNDLGERRKQLREAILSVVGAAP